MENHFKGMRNLGVLLSRFKTIKNKPPNTLFDVDLDWNKVKQGLCPYCGKPLIKPLKRSIMYCKRKRCIAPNNKGFVIKLSTLEKMK